MHQLSPTEKEFEFGTTKSISVPTNQNLPDNITSHIYSALRDLYVIFDKSILSSSPKLVDIYSTGTVDSCSWTKNEQKIHIIM